MIFYLLSALLSLYCVYLMAFRAYTTKYKYDIGEYEPTDKRIVYPRIVYILMVAVCFIPIGNTVFCAVFFGVSLVAHQNGDLYVKSWLFEELEKTRKKD